MFGALVAIAIIHFAPPASWLMETWYGAATTGAVSGAAGAAANGGKILRGALTGAISGAAFFGIGNEFSGIKAIGAHATTGGLISLAQGGKFGHGFVSAGLTKAFNINRLGLDGASKAAEDAVRTLVAGLVGGTISAATGGKFANGATTAALAQAFNGNLDLKREADAQGESRQLSWDEYLQEIEDGGARIGTVSSSDKRLAKALTSNVEFQEEASRIFGEANASGRETQGIRIYKVNGNHYFMNTYTGSPCSNGSSTCMVLPPVIRYSNWDLVLTWHPHPNGSGLPSSSDYITNSYDESIGSLWHEQGKATYYRGERR